MPSPWSSVRVVMPFSVPPKPKHLCGIHEGFRAIPHELKLWMHPRWSMIPFTGQRPTTGSTSNFNDRAGWKEFYGDIKEMIPVDAPEPRCKPVVIRAIVDSDHAGTRRRVVLALVFWSLSLWL